MFRTPSRAREPSIADVCANCGHRLPVTDALIEYETSDGQSEQFADYPGYEDGVHLA